MHAKKTHFFSPKHMWIFSPTKYPHGGYFFGGGWGQGATDVAESAEARASLSHPSPASHVVNQSFLIDWQVSQCRLIAMPSPRHPKSQPASPVGQFCIG